MFCPDTLENYFTSAFFNEGFLHSGVIGFTGGAILGQLFEMRYVKINLTNTQSRKRHSRANTNFSRMMKT
jgi:hypothetical protein